MRPASKPINSEVKFYELTPKTESSKARVSRPNTKTVHQLSLKGKPDALIEFEYRGTVIYAKPQAAPKRAKLFWGAHSRSKNRKDAARLASSQLTKDINRQPGTQDSSEVQDQLARVRAQIAKSSCVLAADLQALFDKTNACTEQHRLDARVKAAAPKMNEPANRAFLNTLLSKQVTPKFTRTSINEFLGFIRKATDPGTSSLDYQQARDFAMNWAIATPKHALGSLKDRYLIDNFVDLIMRGCGMDARPPAQQALRQFTRINADKLKADGKEFMREPDLLGKGAFGSVHTYKSSDGETVAVKVFAPRDDNSPRAEARVHAQAQTGQSDHIAKLLDTVELPDGGLMLILEHAPNGDTAKIHGHILSKLMNEELDQQSSDAFMTMFADMVKGVNEAHTNNVMHLDIKPDNFVVNADGECLLVDFGNSHDVLAKTVERQGDVPDFVAPEVVNNHKTPGLTTYKADVWSLGVILYQFNSPRLSAALKQDNPRLLRPFPYLFLAEGDSLIQGFAKEELVDKRFELLDFHSELERPLDQLIVQMLDPDPLKRPALEAVLAHPSIRQYANPINPDELAIVRNARKLIVEARGQQSLNI